MVRIRLTRTGRTHLATYRIVVTPQREKRDSKAIEQIGNYSPVTKALTIDSERVKYWIGVGAQPSDTVRYLFVKEGLLPKSKAKPNFKKAPGKKTQARAKAAEDKKQKEADAKAAAKAAEAAAKETPVVEETAAEATEQPAE